MVDGFSLGQWCYVSMGSLITLRVSKSLRNTPDIEPTCQKLAGLPASMIRIEGTPVWKRSSWQFVDGKTFSLLLCGELNLDRYPLQLGSPAS